MWVARSKYGTIALYNVKPIRAEYFWYADTRDTYDCLPIDKDLFPNLRWEDEPIEVSLILSTPINDEELDKSASEYCEQLETVPDDWFNKRRCRLLIRSAYEAGYRKAKEL